MQQAGVDSHTSDVVVNRGGDRDIPPGLGDGWATRWTDEEIAALATMIQADCIDHVYRMLGDLLYSPSTALERAIYAATQAIDPDFQAAGQAALVLRDILHNFQKPIYRRKVSPHSDIEYERIGEIDIETTKVIIEVTTQRSASGKIAQLRRLLSPERNHFDGIVVIPHTNTPQPVGFYMPNLTSTRAAHALLLAGAIGVYRTLLDLETGVRSV
jgi:hypothetical protein